MDLKARIRRRRRTSREPELLVDYDAISPVVHADEPTGRGPVLERLLDHLDPVFDGKLPPNGYVHGPPGSGKSAVVTALCSHLAQLAAESRSGIHTSTRRTSPRLPAFVYLDLRRTRSEFAFYHRVLDALADEAVPERGISTEAVRRRLHDHLGSARNDVVVVVDHAGETTPTDSLVDLFAGLPSSADWLAVGRADPTETDLTDYTATTIGLQPYGHRMLVDVLTTRASRGLAQGALDHEQARAIAATADGDAADALTVLFVAADLADRRGGTRITDADVSAAVNEMPPSPVPLARVLALPDNRLAVLRRLVDLDPGQRASVDAATAAIADDPDVSLSAGTVKRFLYELAEMGVVERVTAEPATDAGRPPSRVELGFSPTAFRRLTDLQR